MQHLGCYILDEFEGEGGRFFFNMVKAGDEVMFATEEDADRLNWIYKLYTATGQSHKPTLPSKMVVGGTADQTLQKVKGGQKLSCFMYICRTGIIMEIKIR